MSSVMPLEVVCDNNHIWYISLILSLSQAQYITISEWSIVNELHRWHLQALVGVVKEKASIAVVAYSERPWLTLLRYAHLMILNGEEYEMILQVFEQRLLTYTQGSIKEHGEWKKWCTLGNVYFADKLLPEVLMVVLLHWQFTAGNECVWIGGWNIVDKLHGQLFHSLRWCGKRESLNSSGGLLLLISTDATAWTQTCLLLGGEGNWRYITIYLDMSPISSQQSNDLVNINSPAVQQCAGPRCVDENWTPIWFQTLHHPTGGGSRERAYTAMPYSIANRFHAELTYPKFAGFVYLL